MTAESAWNSAFAVRVDGSRRSAASARRWTSARVSGRAMASSSHIRKRLEKNAHMLKDPFVVEALPVTIGVKQPKPNIRNGCGWLCGARRIRSARQAISERATKATNKQSEPVHDGQQGAMPTAATRILVPLAVVTAATMHHDRARKYGRMAAGIVMVWPTAATATA